MLGFAGLTANLRGMADPSRGRSSDRESFSEEASNLLSMVDRDDKLTMTIALQEKGQLGLRVRGNDFL
jgi:hypothetical protein